MKPNNYLYALGWIATIGVVAGAVIMILGMIDGDPVRIIVGLWIVLTVLPVYLIPAAVVHALADVHDRLPRQKLPHS